MINNFSQIISLVDKKSETSEYVIFDTPGQIEVFTWSASGAIISEALVRLSYGVQIRDWTNFVI